MLPRCRMEFQGSASTPLRSIHTGESLLQLHRLGTLRRDLLSYNGRMSILYFDFVSVRFQCLSCLPLEWLRKTSRTLFGAGNGC